MTDAPTQRPSRAGLYAPFIIVLIALAAWTGWWFYLTRQIDAGLESQSAALRQQGWDVRYADKRIVGWPFRANVKLTHVTIAAPSGHAISAPELSSAICRALLVPRRIAALSTLMIWAQLGQ